MQLLQSGMSKSWINSIRRLTSEIRNGWTFLNIGRSFGIDLTIRKMAGYLHPLEQASASFCQSTTEVFINLIKDKPFYVILS